MGFLRKFSSRHENATIIENTLSTGSVKKVSNKDTQTAINKIQKMFWDEYAYLIPFVVTNLGILHANFLIRSLISLQRRGWKPPCSKHETETTYEISIDNAVTSHNCNGSMVAHSQPTFENEPIAQQLDGSEQANDFLVKENCTEVPVKQKRSRKRTPFPLSQIQVGPTIFEIMEGKEFTSTWQLNEHCFLSKVLDLYICQCAEMDDFRVAAGVCPAQAGRMFGDVVFQYEEENAKSYCFVMVVKPEDSQSGKITSKNLTSLKDPTFSLLPLFESYIGVRQQFTDSAIDPSHVRFLIVHTTAIFESSKFQFLDGVKEATKISKRESKISIIKLADKVLSSNSYQIKIPRKKLKHYSGGDEARKVLFLEFLEKLVFSVNQPDAGQIDNAIMDVLNQKLNLVESRFIFHEMIGAIHNLPKSPTEKVVGEELKTFFQNIRKHLQRLHFSGAVLENHCGDLCNEDYFKTYEPILGSLRARADGTDAVVAPLLCITTKTSALTTFKVTHCLRCIYGDRRSFAVVDTLSLLKNRERVEDTFRFRSEFVLVIKWGEVGAKMKEEVDILVTNLITMATNPEKSGKKTLVLIEDTTKDFTDLKIYAETCNLIEDRCEFINFTDEIKTQFMKNRFQFQGQAIVLSDVINNWELKSLESRVMLLNQIIEDGQKCFSSNYRL